MSQTISPLDNRYSKIAYALGSYFSEEAFIQYLIRVELAYLEKLLPILDIEISAELSHWLANLDTNLNRIVQRSKAFEKQTRHDVKAIEYAIQEALEKTGLGQYKEWIHWGLTSEDVNNLAYGCMLSSALNEVIKPAWGEVLNALSKQIEHTHSIPMLARTHGQPASPTTVGKEWAVFGQRWLGELDVLSNLKAGGKQNGATGNWHVQHLLYPKINWLAFSQEFVESLGLQFEPLTTQIVVRESYARIFDSLRRLNNISIDCSRDCWHYISLGYFKLRKESETQVGSSTMPHKVNPIHFENAEGNFELANSLLAFLSDKLLKSRLQRDLSDSTVLRNIGVALGHTLLGCQSLVRGFAQLDCDEQELRADLNQHWEVLAEPLQQWMRTQEMEIPYDRLRQATQGQKFDQAGFNQLCQDLDIDPPVQSPEDYTGIASELASMVLERIKAYS